MTMGDWLDLLPEMMTGVLFYCKIPRTTHLQPIVLVK